MSAERLLRGTVKPSQFAGGGWHVRFIPQSGHFSAWCEIGHAGLICAGLESGERAQESCVMLLRPQFNHYCEAVGRASAIVAFVTMTSLILAATAVDVLR
jgi:hypothetical protein